jgi:aspartyl-tRNA(Asn)/glutamyl-tRNA(Gln) amidotransferase subunit B
MIERARAAIPELPATRAERLEGVGLSPDTAHLLAFRPDLGKLFEDAYASDPANARPLANWVTNEVAARVGSTDSSLGELKAESLAQLVGMVEQKRVSASAARGVLDVLIQTGGDPEAIVEQEGLGSAGGDELEQIVERAMSDQPDAVEKVKEGNEKAIGAIMGAVMRETRGRADGAEVQRMIRERIGS